MNPSWIASTRSTLRRRGVTLLEIVLAFGLLVAVSSMTYWFYSCSLETGKKGTDEAQRIRLARVVLERIATEIRQAATATIDGRVGVRGGPERIWLSTYRVPSRGPTTTRTRDDQPPPGEYDLAKVEYKIVRHPEILHDDGYEFPLGLARIELLIPRPDSAELAQPLEEQQPLEEGSEAEGDQAEPEGQEDAGRIEERQRIAEEERDEVSLAPDIQWDELYAPEIRYLRFCYYDGHKWWDRWEVSGEVPLPQLVQITIGFDPCPPFDFEQGADKENEEFCTCLNEEPVDCLPLAADQWSTVVRIPQADPLFRSRITRETQALMEDLSAEPLP